MAKLYYRIRVEGSLDMYLDTDYGDTPVTAQEALEIERENLDEYGAENIGIELSSNNVELSLEPFNDE